MKHEHSLPPTARRSRSPLILGLAALALLPAALMGCGGDSGSGGSSANVQDSLIRYPGDTVDFIVDYNEGGNSNNLRILGFRWGRLVDIYSLENAQTGAKVLRFPDFVIGADVFSDGVDYELSRNALTGEERLTILYPYPTSLSGDLGEYDPDPNSNSALSRLILTVPPIMDKSLDPGELPPFTKVARNGVVVVQFNDLIDSSLLSPGTVRILAGNPPQTPIEGRRFVDRNFGDIVTSGSVGQFYSTRVIFDPTTSPFDPVPPGQPVTSPNLLGFPEAVTVSQANLALRIPTRENAAVGQFQILRNLSGHALSFGGNGSIDPNSSTSDVVRGFRSGGQFDVTGDAFNGFLPDLTPPSIVGSQDITITSMTQLQTPTVSMNFSFATLHCGLMPEIGDVVRLPGGIVGEVIADAQPPDPVTGAVANVLLQSVVGDLYGIAGGPTNIQAVFLSPFEPGEADRPECFVAFSPPATTPPVAGNIPGVLPTAGAVVDFSEPMNPGSIEAFSSMVMTKSPPPLDSLEARLVGAVSASTDLTRFVLQPSVPIPHAIGIAETYLFDVTAGVQDLAGNALADTLTGINFEMDPNAASADSFGVSLLFEESNQNGLDGHEMRGQFTFDNSSGSIVPRPVTRFSAVGDVDKPTVGQMTPLSASVQEPLVPYGSRLQTVWRYFDLGLPLLDESTHNLSVEGISWAPFSGISSIDNFSEFQVLLAHSFKLPDEGLDPQSGGPLYLTTGLEVTFDSNYLDTPMVVHDKSAGYTINPLNAFQTATGRTMIPWPVNRNVTSTDQIRRFVWRDTREVAVGAPAGVGADTWVQDNLGISEKTRYYDRNEVPTVGLPLLMEFRCYPDDFAFGTNGFQMAFALNPLVFGTTRPDFTVFSAGGVDPNGVIQRVQPDSNLSAQGGYNPGSLPPGQPTLGNWNAFMYGQADFVVAVSTVHTIWFSAGSTNTSWAAPVVEPASSALPSGTEVQLHFRGASDIPNGVASTLTHSAEAAMEFYGNPHNFNPPTPPPPQPPVYFNGDATWKSAADISQLDGAPWIQARITFISNPDSLLTPRISALGIAATR